MTSERLDELIQKYVLGNLTESEATEFSDHLDQDDAVDSRRKLRLALRADAYLQEAAADLDTSESKLEKGSFLKLERILWPLGSIAAAIAIGIFTWSQGPDNQLADERVGTIHRIEGEARNQMGDILHDSGWLQAEDQISMEEGLVEIVFRDTGVHAVATAPLSMTVHGNDKVFLHKGDLKLHVPPQGVGFVVETEEREITDLGTSFVVSARTDESRVLVLDGLVTVGKKVGDEERYMSEGEAATFSKKGDFRMMVKKVSKMQDISLATSEKGEPSLPGEIYSFTSDNLPELDANIDSLGNQFLPLVKSGFENRKRLASLQKGSSTFPFNGIAGAYNQFAARHGTNLSSADQGGWLVWHSGKVRPPEAGRYRFWGYADNSLVVAIDGKPVFEAGRYDSAFRKSGNISRQNHPAWPCLNSQAGFASGPWFDVGNSPVKVDLLFGEKSGNLTYGLLLIEREGGSCEPAAWGQPRWPVFLTSPPGEERRQQLDELRDFMETRLLGSFSVDGDAVWTVAP